MGKTKLCPMLSSGLRTQCMGQGGCPGGKDWCLWEMESEMLNVKCLYRSYNHSIIEHSSCRKRYTPQKAKHDAAAKLIDQKCAQRKLQIAMLGNQPQVEISLDTSRHIFDTCVEICRNVSSKISTWGWFPSVAICNLRCAHFWSISLAAASCFAFCGVYLFLQLLCSMIEWL